MEQFWSSLMPRRAKRLVRPSRQIETELVVKDNIVDELTEVYKHLLLHVCFDSDGFDWSRGAHIQLHDGLWVSFRLSL